MRKLGPVPVLSLSSLCAAQEPGRDQQIAETLRALPEAMSFSTALDSFRPWPMDEGTLMAHIMMPGNESNRCVRR